MSLGELLSYTEEEREKWRVWLLANPQALALRMQPEGRFATVGALVDHIFLVEVRHLARLQRQEVPTASGVAMEDFGALRLRRRGTDRASPVRGQPDRGRRVDAARVHRAIRHGHLTPRKLLFHIALHETRHWAQIALAVRQAGLEPPGNHDLFYSQALR